MPVSAPMGKDERITMLKEMQTSRPAKLAAAHARLPSRPRRLRATPALRAMVRETELQAQHFVYPLFVRHGRGRSEIRSMPGVFQLSVDDAVQEAEAAASLGVNAVILFGIPSQKDPIGLENFA